MKDVEFVRKWWGILNGAHYINVVVRIDGENRRYEGEELKRLLSFLVESEAMREKAEWQVRHIDCQRTDGGTWFCKGPMVDARHDDTDADWIEAVRREWRI